MAIRNIKKDVFYVGALDWDNRLFDAFIPLPDGTSYNSYLIKGTEKTALIDTVDPVKESEFLKNLEDLKLDKIDYIVSLHSELDHSGVIPKILEMYPEAKVVTNSKCRDFLKEFFLLPEEKFITICNEDTICLGNKTIKFVFAPWVHWPDTMFAYLIEDKILFSTDLFGSHISTSDLFVNNDARVIEAAKRYYAQIMMPFRNNVIINLKKLEDLEIDVIAPSHGQLYADPSLIVNAYKIWSSEKVKNEVVIPYVSSHGCTESMVNYLIDKLISKGIGVKPFNLVKSDIGELAMALVDAATIVLATPTILAGAHPGAAYAAILINALRPKTKFMSIIGSYSWGGKMVESIEGLMGNLKVEMITPVVIKGNLKGEDRKKLDDLAESINEKHKSIGIGPQF